MLEFIAIEKYATDRNALAGKLNLTTDDLERYLQNLISIGYVEIRNSKIFDLTDGHSTTTHFSSSNKALVDLQEGILNEAIQALHKFPIERRDHSSVTVKTSYKKISEAKEKIKTFRRELMVFLEDTAEADSVYQMALSFFPIE